MKSSSTYRAMARDSLAGNWMPGILSCLFVAILSGVFSFISTRMAPGLASILFSLVYSAVVGVAACGIFCVALDYTHGRNPEVGSIFSLMPIFPRIIVLNLIVSIGTVIATLFFIIPGIIFAYTFAIVPIIVADNPDMSLSEVLSYSARLMKGHRFELFCLNLSFIGWAFLSVLTCGIGYIFLLPYIYVTEAHFYNDLKLSEGF